MTISKNVRIYQLTRASDFEKRFVPYTDILQKFGDVAAADYACVFDGNLGTEDLEEIYGKCNTAFPDGFTGHSLSVSDVVELYGGSESSFYYVDPIGFHLIPFEAARCQTNQPEMKI